MGKRLISLALVALFVVALFAGCTPAEKNENKITVGNTTETSGDFIWPGFGTSSAGAADQDVNKLTIGLGTMEINQEGNYVWSKTVVKSHTRGRDRQGRSQESAHHDRTERGTEIQRRLGDQGG